MNILIITKTFPAELETFTVNHVLGMAYRGHAVTVIAEKPGIKKFYVSPSVADKITVKFFSAKRRTFAVLYTIFSSLFFLFFHPIHFTKVLRQIGLHKNYNVLQAFMAARLVSKSSFDITHAEFGPLGNIAIALKTCGVRTGPLCVSFRGADISSYLNRKPFTYKLILEEGDVFLPICDSFIQRLRLIGFPEKKIITVHSAINLSLFTFRTLRKKNSAVIKLISAGRFLPTKEFSQAIEAAAALKKNGVPVTLELIGDGPEKEYFKAKAMNLGIREEVIFPGWISQDEIGRHLMDADIFIGVSNTSSSGDMEEIPNIMKEAMAVGLPVIAYNHSGLDELIRHGETGYLISENNISCMVEIIMNIINSDAMVSGIVSNARTLIEEEYASISQSKRMEQIYVTLISKYEKKRNCFAAKEYFPGNKTIYLES
ncbi:glycosyltransferase [Breznakiella homolactica]|uniref:Glycosyltransferase n=1 Tax=Breznakiella homolactica TaxID=2798577 RepID=A0A7T7XLI9_9SPIR|nr:glycosyltransferase [Breznakiella homolactica]QQO08516.1 glycosyltransferase [Breznakiella homolactica]